MTGAGSSIVHPHEHASLDRRVAALERAADEQARTNLLLLRCVNTLQTAAFVLIAWLILVTAALLGVLGVHW